MFETDKDLERLQGLLDDSYAAAGAHLRSIITPERRLTAEQLTTLLVGVQVLNLATVTAAGEPRVSPVDGLFYRGQFWFGSADDSVRFRHIRARPQVSATHVRGEELAVTVHGRAREITVSDEEHAGFREYLTKTYGQVMDQWEGKPVPYAVIDAAKMFTFAMNPQELVAAAS